MSTKIVIITTTVDKKKKAEKLCEKLLNKKLIACGQISAALTSHYWWQGEIVHGQEFQLNVKTTDNNLKKVIKLIEKHHPYDTPEIICKFPDHVNGSYMKWLKGEVI